VTLLAISGKPISEFFKFGAKKEKREIFKMSSRPDSKILHTFATLKEKCLLKIVPVH
jgi:hypothetical protein